MSPSEVGHAAAYEAYRTWLHNTSLREPLSGDLDRQREGLAGLAVAEGISTHEVIDTSHIAHSISFTSVFDPSHG